MSSNPISPMSDLEKKPALRISPYVYGRTAVKNRVTYLIDSKGEGTETGVPERVVLTRWRQRRFENHTFSGAKMSSTLWRAVHLAFGSDANVICALSLADIQAVKDESAKVLSASGFLKLPSASVLQALFAVCGPERLEVLLTKHTSKEHGGKSGVPDLFLYAINNLTGKPSIARFVEVKKPKEEVSDDQKAEIALLNAMGLHARVIRLIEKEHKLTA
jgi:hypothetical protein